LVFGDAGGAADGDHVGAGGVVALAVADGSPY
jgi:hypothetical protein